MVQATLLSENINLINEDALKFYSNLFQVISDILFEVMFEDGKILKDPTHLVLPTNVVYGQLDKQSGLIIF